MILLYIFYGLCSQKKIEMKLFIYIYIKTLTSFDSLLFTFIMQSVSINIASLPHDYPSICIPRVFSNIQWQFVKNTIEQLGLGLVSRVDMIPKTNDKGDKFQRVFIHMKFWDSSEQAQIVRQKLLSGDTIKIVYNDPWYWQLSMSRIAKPTFHKKTHDSSSSSHSKPRIVIDHSVPTPSNYRPTWTTPSLTPQLTPSASSAPHSPPLSFQDPPSAPSPPSAPHTPPLTPTLSLGPHSPPLSFQDPPSQPIKKIIRRVKKQ